MNKLELFDHGHSEDFKMKINGAEIDSISEYKIKRTFEETELELRLCQVICVSFFKNFYFYMSANIFFIKKLFWLTLFY